MDFKVTARLKRLREGLNNTYILNEDIRLLKNSWKYCLPHTPFTIYIPLTETDVDFENKKLNSIQGHNFSELLLLISINGKCPDLNSEFHHFKQYEIPISIEWKRFNDIETDNNLKNSTKWIGWSEFDG